MDFIQVHKGNIQAVTAERNKHLPPVLSSLHNVDNHQQFIQNVTFCLKYVSTYDLTSINEELLQYIIPPIKEVITKLSDNFFAFEDVKRNIQVAKAVMQVLETILESLGKYEEINLCNFDTTFAKFADVIIATLEQCKNGNDDSTNETYRVEIMELFCVTQKVHLMFLKLFETNIVVEAESDGKAKEIGSLMEVMGAICTMGEILINLNKKSMTNNWKSYINIAEKFSSSLMPHFKPSKPVLCLGYEIHRRLLKIEEQKELDLKTTTVELKITSFLIKVTMKVCNIFWDALQHIPKDLFIFCSMVYSFPLDLFVSKGFPLDFILLVESSIYNIMRPFVLRLLKNTTCVKDFSENITPDISSFGCAFLFSNILQLFITNEIDPVQINVSGVINAIFESVLTCFPEFFWDPCLKQTIFDGLIINISAAVIKCGECYGEVEGILLKYLLQEHIFAAILAMEIWTLLLRNSSPHFRLQTLHSLLKKYQELDLGIFTRRPESVYIQCFIQRVFRMLPNDTKNDCVLCLNSTGVMECWKVVQLKTFPQTQQLLSDEDVYTVTVDIVDALRRGNGNFRAVVSLAENLKALSTTNISKVDKNNLKLLKLVILVYSLWEFQIGGGVIENHIFKYFITALCKITSAFERAFTMTQIILILSQLKILSHYDSYKLVISDFISSLSGRPKLVNQPKLDALIVEIITCNLLTPCNIIKQNVLESVDSFVANKRRDIVQSIVPTSKEMYSEITYYLQRNTTAKGFFKDYLSYLAEIPFQHACLEWRSETESRPSEPKSKKSRSNENIEVVPRGDVFNKSACTRKPNDAPRSQDENNPEGTVREVITNIKGEVKCLVNVLKTEKLTAKQCSDLRLLAQQLLSLL